MGHEILLYKGRHAIINDFDLEAVRHFLLVASDAAGFQDVADFVGDWKYECPGVWSGLDLDPFLHGDENLERRFCEVLDSALVRVLAFGDSIPSDYLEKHVNLSEGRTWGSGTPTKLVLDAMGLLRDLFSKSPPPAETT
jgi:hypothetical protein